MAEPTVKRLPAIPKRGVVIKTWAKDTTQAVRDLAGGVRAPESSAFLGVQRGTIRMEVVSESDDHIVCKYIGIDGVAYASDINVAKPYLLRRTPFDGVARAGITYTYTASNTRTASDGVDQETQVIVPSYAAGEPVFISSVQPHTGVVLSDVNLRLVDMNIDARAWAKEAT